MCYNKKIKYLPRTRMNSDELVKFAFDSATVYPPEKQYNFRADEDFASFLHLHYPEVEDFVDSIRAGKIELKDCQEGLAAIGVFPRLTLWLNTNKLTAMKEKCGVLERYDFYETLACLLLHEKSHYSLQHFRVPFPAYDHNLLNIAQDMVIDTRIHRKNPQWRNWQETIAQINRQIDEAHAPLPKISADPQDRYYVLHLSDLDIYHYLDALRIENLQTPPRFDEHKWENQPDNAGNNLPSPQGNPPPTDSQGDTSEEKSDSQKEKPAKELPYGFDELMDKWCAKSRARLSQNSQRHVAEGAAVMDEMMHVIASGKEHNLFHLLQKFIKKISYKQTRYTWKKISKKQPFRKPGVLYKKSPGEVLLMIDTSASMHAFINQHIAEMAQGVYAAFARLSRVYGVPSLMYKADVDDRVLSFKEIEKVEDLKEIDLTGGRGNNFEKIFDKLVLHWKEKTKSAQKFPDFILVLTDFGDDWEFLDRPEYKQVAEKIIWLSTDPYCPHRPSKGYIVNVLADDWSVSIR